MVFSRLLDLPPEIRSQIFEHAVTSDKPVVAFRLDSWQRDSYTEATQPALSRVSRLLRSESLPLFYECNNFILHTESPKAEHAQRWLRCTSAYLENLRRVSLWLRYCPLTNDRASSQGAICVSLNRPRKHEPWDVHDWNWVTVVRKPAELQGDAKFILEKLGSMLAEVSREGAMPTDYGALLTDLRLFYVQFKMS